MKTIASVGIDTSGLLLSDRVFTTLAFVTLDENGDREFSFARKPGADTQLCFDELKLSLIDEARVFHFGSLSMTDEPARSATYRAVEYAKSRGKLISFDPNFRRPLWRDPYDARAQMLWGLGQADVVKLSEEEAEFLFGMSPETAAEHIVDKYGVRLVYVTCGAEGCRYRTAALQGLERGLRGIKTVDTTGAGDIFGGAALSGLLKSGKEPEQLSAQELRGIVAFASAAAGLSTMRHGGISSVPELSRVQEILAKEL